MNRKAKKPVSKRKANIPARRPTKKQIRIMKEYWKQLMDDETQHQILSHNTEKLMEKETGITGIEFFGYNGEYEGIRLYGVWELDTNELEG